ncbi:MAG: histidine--tRNA ligase [Acidobacteriota bacterium]
MSQIPRTVKGTRDLLPPETALWSAVEEIARRVFTAYGFGEIRTPILESTELFVRGVGESTDIVGKEMFTFEDKKGRSVTLRPENTAAVARAFIEHGMASWPSPVRLFYLGPQFRYERPQKGRYRQFHQLGAETLGDDGPLSDAEILLLLLRFFSQLGFRDLEVRLNTVGDAASRQAYGEALRSYFGPHRERLGADSRRRLGENPLRILDTKVPQERELVAGAPPLAGFLTAESRQHFSDLCGLLDRFGAAYQVDDRLVRGLDYYTRTVFEIVSGDLGAQNAVCGGGRYDRLISDLGGPEVPGIGFAVGLDRLIDILPEDFRRSATASPPVYVLPIGGVEPDEALVVAEGLRAAGVEAVPELAARSMKSALKRAARAGARYVVLLGEQELGSGRLTIKDLETREQFRDTAEGLAERLTLPEDSAS